MRTICITLLGFMALALPGCFDSKGGLLFECSDRTKLELTSLNKKFIATVFERDCGATTDFSTIVSVRERSRPFESDDQGILLVTKGRNEVRLAWMSGNRLSITFPKTEVYKKETSWGEVNATYHELSRSGVGH